LAEEQEATSIQSQIEKENMDHAKSLNSLAKQYYTERALKLSTETNTP